MFKRLVSVALLLVALSAPAMAAPGRDDGDRTGSAIRRITRFIQRVFHPLDNFDLSFPKP
jgi:hypothetical protein